MIKSSTLNFVRQKADEARQLADLHEALTDVANRDREIKEAEARLSRLKADGDKAAEQVRNLQQAVEARKADLDRATSGVASAKNEADSIVERANKRASEIVSEGAKARADHLTDWDKSIDNKRSELRGVLSELQSTDAELASRKKEHAELSKAHDELVRKHAALQQALAAARSSL